jgi:hypothetical protein
VTPAWRLARRHLAERAKWISFLVGQAPLGSLQWRVPTRKKGGGAERRGGRVQGAVRHSTPKEGKHRPPKEGKHRPPSEAGHARGGLARPFRGGLAVSRPGGCRQSAWGLPSVGLGAAVSRPGGCRQSAWGLPSVGLGASVGLLPAAARPGGCRLLPASAKGSAPTRCRPWKRSAPEPSEGEARLSLVKVTELVRL